MTDPLTPVLSANWDDERSWKLLNYERQGGYAGLRKALTMQPDEVVSLVKDANLRGRGGAGFPTGMKWSFVPKDNPNPTYLVVNGDESEPGTCKDIPLMMAAPQFLIEGVAITSFAIGCHHAFIYLRGEVVHVYRRLLRAVEEAYAAGHLGKNIHGSGFDLDVTVHAGAGAYICGEETALLDSLEGRRGQPRLKPPFPAVAGLYARPTVVNNVESIASVPSILLHGSDWFADMGTEKSQGFGIFSLSGHVKRPGQYEAPLGITLRELIDMAGGMRDRLVEQRQRIAHRTFGRARDDAERLGLDLDAFLGGDIAEMLHQHVGLDAAQVEALAARQHRDRNLADLGGGEHELGVLRRLLQRLQEGVEGRRRQHVDFVDDVDLVARARRRIAHAVIDLADIVDAGVGRSVHLQHVHVPAFHDRLAVHAEVRHVDGRPLHRAVGLLVVQGAGEDAGGGGLADPADAGEDPGLRNSPGLERVRDGADHGLLADQVLEAGGAVFAGENAVGLVGRLRQPAEIETALVRTVGRSGGVASAVHASIRNLGVSSAGVRTGAEIERRARRPPFQRDSLGKNR